MHCSAPLPVVCALLADGTGRVLIARRPPHKHLGGLWEFPGGKIEPGETPAAALVRELEEELGTTVVAGEALPPFEHAYAAVTIEMYAIRCRLAAGAPPPVPHEHTELAWVEPSALGGYTLCPADIPLLPVLVAK